MLGEKYGMSLSIIHGKTQADDSSSIKPGETLLFVFQIMIPFCIQFFGEDLQILGKH